MSCIKRQYQKLSIRFHPHALDRLQQRLPNIKKEKLRNKLRHRIPAELKKGARPNESGALKIEVEVGSGIWAVCFASYLGGWEVMTVYRDYERRDAEMEEKAEYGSVEINGEKIGFVEKLRLNDGDILVFKVPLKISSEEIKRIMRGMDLAIKGAGYKNVSVVTIDSDVKLMALTKGGDVINE